MSTCCTYATYCHNLLICFIIYGKREFLDYQDNMIILALNVARDSRIIRSVSKEA